MPDSTAVTIYPSKRKLVGTLLFAVASVVLGVSFARVPIRPGFTNILIAVTSYVIIAFFGAVAIYLGYRLLGRQPALVISQDGILDRSSSVCVGLIRWAEIEALVPYTRLGQRFLGIVLVDPDTLIRRQPWFRRWLLASNRRLGFPPINVVQATLPVDLEKLAQQLARDYGVQIRRAV